MNPIGTVYMKCAEAPKTTWIREGERQNELSATNNSVVGGLSLPPVLEPGLDCMKV